MTPTIPTYRPLLTPGRLALAIVAVALLGHIALVLPNLLPAADTFVGSGTAGLCNIRPA